MQISLCYIEHRGDNIDGPCAVDIDHCYKDVVLSEMAVDIINAMNSYTEFSPSGGEMRI